MRGKVYFVLLFLYVVLQGALRKWAFPSLGTPLYLFQYVLLYLFYLSVPKSQEDTNFKPAFHGLLMFYVVFGALEMVNMRGTTNLIVQVYGFAMHFSFVPLLFYMSRIFPEEKTLFLYLRWLAYILIPLFFLGTVQYFLSQDAFLNRYATDMETGDYEVAIGSGGKVRIAGTFSYLATYASFLCFILHLLFYATLVSLIQKKLNWYYAVAYGMGIVNLFMTSSRGATFYYFGTEACVVLLLTLSGQAKFLNNLVPLILVLGIGYFIITSTDAGTTAIADFIARTTTTNDMAGRLDDSFSPFKFFNSTGLFGFGIGTAQAPMGVYLTNRWEMPFYWEEEGERINIELGVVGFLIIMSLRWVVFLTCWRIYKRIKTLDYKILALIMTMFQLPFLINLQTNIFNYIDGLFYWMSIGLVYVARIFDGKQQKKENEPESSEELNTQHQLN